MSAPVASFALIPLVVGALLVGGGALVALASGLCLELVLRALQRESAGVPQAPLLASAVRAANLTLVSSFMVMMGLAVLAVWR